MSIVGWYWLLTACSSLLILAGILTLMMVFWRQRELGVLHACLELPRGELGSLAQEITQLLNKKGSLTRDQLVEALDNPISRINSALTILALRQQVNVKAGRIQLR